MDKPFYYKCKGRDIVVNPDKTVKFLDDKSDDIEEKVVAFLSESFSIFGKNDGSRYIVTSFEVVKVEDYSDVIFDNMLHNFHVSEDVLDYCYYDNVFLEAVICSLGNGNYWLRLYTNADYIELPKDSSRIFADLNLVTAIDLSMFLTDNVMYATSMFLNMYYVRELDLSGFNLSLCGNIEYMFGHCKQLRNIIFNDKIICRNISTLSETFSGCCNLQKLDLRFILPNSLESISYAFSGCHKLERIIFNEKPVFVSKLFVIECFSGCTSLTDLDLNWLHCTDYLSPTEMFYGCSESMTVKCKNIMYWGSEVDKNDISIYFTEKYRNEIPTVYDLKMLADEC